MKIIRRIVFMGFVIATALGATASTARAGAELRPCENGSPSHYLYVEQDPVIFDTQSETCPQP